MNDDLLNKYKELEDEIKGYLKKISPKVRAERLIQEFCKIDNPSETIIEVFQDWLRENVEVALETDGLEQYFYKVFNHDDLAEECECVPAVDYEFVTDEDGVERVIFRKGGEVS